MDTIPKIVAFATPTISAFTKNEKIIASYVRHPEGNIYFVFTRNIKKIVAFADRIISAPVAC